jgi:hypothetical protein
MEPNLNCSDPEYKRVLSFDNVGFRLEMQAWYTSRTLLHFYLIQYVEEFWLQYSYCNKKHYRNLKNLLPF